VCVCVCVRVCVYVCVYVCACVSLCVFLCSSKKVFKRKREISNVAPRSPVARVGDAERAESREVTEKRLRPHHLRTQLHMEATARGNVVALGQRAAEGRTEEVGPY
jgi:hypothetical protein